MHIILSRTDSIGDVVLTLPMAGILKERYPEAKITFIGRTYTQPVVALSQFVDQFLNWDEIERLKKSNRAKKLKDLKADWIIHVFPNKKVAKAALKAKIKNRVGTSHRTFHWNTCNIRISFSRKKSNLHEAQLNCKLLSILSITVPSIEDISLYYGFSVKLKLRSEIHALIDVKKRNIVLHPKSKGSSREWGLDNFENLAHLMPGDKYKIFITGTAEEGGLMSEFLKKNSEKIVDLTGKLTLDEFIHFLALSDCIVAASTGPLHIAAALGKMAIGIYPPIRPMHPGRWAPLGNNAHCLVKNKLCSDCRKSMDCHCMREISPDEVLGIIEKNMY